MNDIAIALLIGTESRTTFAEDRRHPARPTRRTTSLRDRLARGIQARLGAPAAPAASGC
jgi:hypothetical protein